MIVAIDGPSGVGKSTLLEHLKQMLEARGFSASIVSNNDGTPLGPIIRDFAKDKSLAFSLALVSAASRAYISEKMTEDVTVCDRHVLSTFVYQGYAGIDFEYLYKVNEPFVADVIYVLLYLSAHDLAARRQGRKDNKVDWFKNSFEIQAEIEAYQTAKTNFEARGHRVHEVDASVASSEIAKIITEVISTQIGGQYGQSC